MLAAGVPLKTVSKPLGHSSVSTTGDIYGHLTLATKRYATSVLSRVLSAASN
jgi:integrase